jgi:hypothetical protein
MKRLYESACVHDVLVCRQTVLRDMLCTALRILLSQCLKVTFNNERGDDYGGLTKELSTSFWSEGMIRFSEASCVGCRLCLCTECERSRNTALLLYEF